MAADADSNNAKTPDDADGAGQKKTQSKATFRSIRHTLQCSLCSALKHLNKFASTYLFFAAAASVLILFSWWRDSYWVLLWSIPLLIAITLVTREVKSPADGAAVLRLGYGYALLLTVAAVYAMVGDYRPHFRAGPTVVLSGQEYQHNLIGVLPGCDFARPGSFREEERDREPAAAMPEGARYCGDIPPQWVLNIGGLVLSCHVDGTCHDHHAEKRKTKKRFCRPDSLDPACPGSASRLRSQIDELRHRESVQENAFEQASTALTIAELRQGTGRSRQGDLADIASAREALHRAEEALKRTQRELSLAADSLQRAKVNETRTKAAKQIDENIVPAAPIVGGVTVPVFFIALAVLGALVTMYRKLPEFQYRNDESYKNEFEDNVLGGLKPRDPIPWSQLPDLVVFQMLQVLTAVPVAILAYSFARPEETASAVVLAFVAGLTPEVILMAARNLTDHLISQGPRGPRLSNLQDKIETGVQEAIGLGRASAVLGRKLVRVGDTVELSQEIGSSPAGSKAAVVALGRQDITVAIEGGETVTRPDGFFRAPVDEAVSLLKITPDEEPVG